VKTFYEILELSPGATEAEIKEQYRFLIQAWHPDKFSNPVQKDKALEKAKEINQAYAVLSKPERRKQYDQELAPSPAPAAQSAAPAQPRPTADAHREPPPKPDAWISPLNDYRWLLLFGDEYSYSLDERESKALAGGDFQYRLADWPAIDHAQARTEWQGRGYQVEIAKSPYQLIAGESSRCLTGQASLTSVSIAVDRAAPTTASFGILLNLAYLGDDPQDARRYPGMQGKGVANSYYAFCLQKSGEWKFRYFRDWEDKQGTLVETGFSADIQKSVQRGRPLEVCGVIRDCLPLGQNQVRVRLGINSSLVCDLFAPGHAWRRGGIVVDAPMAGITEMQWVRFSDFQSYFLTQR
jgi:curved DNA-binding protein CbpA